MASEKRVISTVSPQGSEISENPGMKGESSHTKFDSRGYRGVPDGAYQTSDTNNSNPNGNQPDSPMIDVDLVISTLKVPESGAEVVKMHANEHTADRQIQAYAKLAGRNWTYYVQQLEIVIGRSAVDSTDHIDIDLAPSKIVSRRHAVIRYNLTSRYWEVVTFGRNGIRLDGGLLKAGNTHKLSSGNVIDVGNVQMMFVLPDADPVVAPMFVHRLRNIELANSAQHTSENIQAKAAVSGQPKDNNINNNAPISFEPSNVSYPRGVTIVSRPQVASSNYLVEDLGSDECKDIKPPFSYATMISQAILSTPEHMMTLADIYAWIASHYAFYRHSKPGWQNSIRHNLSLNKAFEKVARSKHEPGKGSKWHIVEAYKEELVKKATTGRNLRGGYLPKKPYEDSPSGGSGTGQMHVVRASSGRKRSHSEANVQNFHDNPSNQPRPSNHQLQPQEPLQPQQPQQPQQQHVPMNIQFPNRFQGMPQTQPYQIPMPFQNVSDNQTFPIQGYPYVPPYGMPYYPQQHPGQPMAASVMPSRNSSQDPEASETNQQGDHETEGRDLEHNNESADEKDKLLETASATKTSSASSLKNNESSSNNESQTRKIYDEIPTTENIESRQHQQQHQLTQQASQNSTGDVENNTNEAESAIPENIQMQTPARPARTGTRGIGNTPLLDSHIKLGPPQSSAAPESSPALWKYMNLESTPNNNNTPNSKSQSRNSAGPGITGDDYVPTSSPPRPSNNADITRQNNGMKRVVPLLEKMEGSRA